MKTKLTPTKRQNIGSVSSGTMREEDLIPAFLYELQHQRPMLKGHRKLAAEIAQRSDFPQSEKSGYWEDGDSTSDLADLFDALNEYAPDHFYFGAHPGDGADYGYWLSEFFQQEFDGEQVSDLSDIPADYVGEVLHVNDHGNMTLYRRGRNHRLYEVWAIV